MRLMAWGSSTVRVLLAVLTLAACGDEGTSPNLVDLAGSYRLGTLVVTQPGSAPVDLVQAGTVLDLRISSTGQTSGSVEIPAGTVGNPEPIVGDLTGAVVSTSPSVRFEFENGLVFDDPDYRFEENTLSANSTTDGTSVQITLTRTAN